MKQESEEMSEEIDCEMCIHCIGIHEDMELFCRLLGKIVWDTCNNYEAAM